MKSKHLFSIADCELPIADWLLATGLCCRLTTRSQTPSIANWQLAIGNEKT